MFFKVLVIALICIYKYVLGQEELENHVAVDPNKTYHVYWSVKEDTIIFELQVATLGYVGFGFSPNGEMKGSDVIIGWVLPNGTAIFHDRHALGFYEPLIDSEQNFDLLNAYENATHTVLRFSRKLNTCDKENDNVITDDTIRLIYSWHPADPVNNTGLPYHGKDNRGSRTVFLLSPQPPRAAVTDGIVEWEIHMPNVTIPPQITTYWCIFAQAPEFEEEHQYIGYDIKIAPGNENIVHHFVLFECLGDPARLDEFIAIKGGYECVKEGTLAPPTVCQPPLIVWLAGSEGQRLPADVGIPLGRKFGGTSHFELQIHYNNIEKTPGLVDSSSLILYLTKKKRPIRAAILQGYANIDYTFILPPNQRAFRVSAFAPPECTQSLPEDGITIFATGLHGHLAARKFAIRHFRNNTELKPITVDNQYSFYYQAIRQLKDYVKVYPGDTLMVECEYSTEKSNATVAGGYGTESEMCTFFISYYPKTKLSLCIGGPHNQDIYDYFGVEKLAEDQVHIESPASLQNHSMFDHVKGFDWSKKDNAAINRMAQMQYYDVKKIYCLHNPEDSALDKFVEFAYPTNSIMYPPEPDQCAVKAPVIETYETEESEYESKEATKKSYY